VSGFLDFRDFLGREGVDIAKFKHVARAQDNRGVEFGMSITFENNQEGFSYS